MSALTIKKVVGAPIAPFTPSTIYYSAGTGAGDLTVYLSNKEGTSVRRTVMPSDITAAVQSAVGAYNSATVVQTIADRDALAAGFTANAQVLVLDAKDDVTVGAGAATYIYEHTTTTWYKISEAESMDLILNWGLIVGGPTSAPAALDAAVGWVNTTGALLVSDLDAAELAIGTLQTALANLTTRVDTLESSSTAQAGAIGGLETRLTAAEGTVAGLVTKETAWDLASAFYNTNKTGIEAAIAATHTHTNAATLDKFGEDVGGEPTYNGNFIKAHLDEEAW